MLPIVWLISAYEALKEAFISIGIVAETSIGTMVGDCFAKDGEIDVGEELA